MFLRPSNFKDKQVKCGFFGREGGVSAGIYESLNCGLGTQDDSANVAENRARACHALKLDAGRLLGLVQIHSGDCVTVTDKLWDNDGRPQADAMVTDIPGVALSVVTADCVPVMFYAEKEAGVPVVGIAHAGWKGVVRNILPQTFKAMVALGAKENSIKASIGPCIGPKSYEVTEEFKQPLLSQYTGSEYYFHKTKKKDHYLFDLPGYVKRRLELVGVDDISVCKHDTYAEEDRFFSYRRTTHRKEPDYGRQISIISINE